jgi:pantetheine-phosphate adenylyltransferase
VKRAVYPGSFDPVTNGHIDIITRASRLVDELVVAVMVNPSKNHIFTLEERQDMIRSVCKNLTNVSVSTFSGLLVHYLDEIEIPIIIKGLRAISDFESEFQMAALNTTLDRRVETLFMMTAIENAFLSSSMVRQIAKLRGPVADMVPPIVNDQLIRLFGPPQAGSSQSETTRRSQ